MGFRVENYSLNELHRIAVPGAVAPSLFWALPVGDWRPGELDEVWRWFTEGHGECHDYRLMLLKEMGRREDENANVSLASVGAKLSDLMPSGAERFVRSSAYRGESPRVLVLSGGYPQPGWGVLVEWRRRDIHCFEDLIKRAIAQVKRDEKSTDKLSAFTKSAQAFHRLRDMQTAPVKASVSSLEGEIFAGENMELLMREAQTALESGKHRLIGEKIIAAIQGMRQAAWLETSESSLQALLDTQRRLLTAASIMAVSRDVLLTEIEPKLAELIADPSHRETAFRSLSSDAVKHALKACLHLRTKGALSEAQSFHSWAESTLAQVSPRLAAHLHGVIQSITTKLAAHRGVKAQREHEYIVALGQSRQRSTEAREAFHLAAGKAVELQWELGPQFLVEFKQLCRKGELWIRSIPWDPARMVGWKIMASRVNLDSRDLQIAAQELAPGAIGDSPANGESTAVADGSYFTDYVHYIAISKPGFSPRAVTRDLITRLLRPAEMVRLIESHGRQIPIGADAPHLAEELLDAFGWRNSDDVREKPLAGCIKIAGAAAPTLAKNLSGNDLRIVLESFCKDVLDVVVARLGYTHADVWRAIDERVPDYRPSSRTKDWDEEVRRLMVGRALMLLPAFATLASPERANEFNEFAAVLRQLSEVLNQASHHQSDASISLSSLNHAPVLIRQLLIKAEAYLRELPWHLEASFVYGEQPKVLSGEAWSHGSATPRLLRVIVLAGADRGTHVTLWNPTRRNPIVTDRVYIVRPRRH
ncbi:MAG: hypothetical protein ABI871_06170 [Chthoniobacterales bacterium]